MPELDPVQWLWAVMAAFGVGVSKSGFAGVGLFHVVVFAHLFGPQSSTGVVLPMLIVGDVSAVTVVKQQVRWDYVRKLLGPTLLGVIAGWLLMSKIETAVYGLMMGLMILGLIAMQLARTWKPGWFADAPHAWWFVWGTGLLAGISTMLANAAGPIVALYLVAVALPKLELVGTVAWFFLILNVFKVPFSAQQGLINSETLLLNGILVPAILTGLMAGRWLILRVSQRLFDSLVLMFSALAAIKLIAAYWSGR